MNFQEQQHKRIKYKELLKNNLILSKIFCNKAQQVLKQQATTIKQQKSKVIKWV